MNVKKKPKPKPKPKPKRQPAQLMVDGLPSLPPEILIELARCFARAAIKAWQVRNGVDEESEQ